MTDDELADVLAEVRAPAEGAGSDCGKTISAGAQDAEPQAVVTSHLDAQDDETAPNVAAFIAAKKSQKILRADDETVTPPGWGPIGGSVWVIA